MDNRVGRCARVRRRVSSHGLSSANAVESLEQRTRLAAGLVAASAFDVAAGAAAADASGLGNAAAVSGATWAPGRYGTALSFDGVNDMASVADADSLDLTTGMTLEAWVKPNARSDWGTVLLKDRGAGLAYSLYGTDGANRPPSAYVNRNRDIRVLGGSALPLGAWSHLAATYDGSALRLYVNGALASTTAVTGAVPATSNPLRIGGNTVWGEYFNGVIDEVRVYNRALAAAEIQADMNTPVVAAPPPGPDTLPPAVSLTAPAAGAEVAGTTSVTAAASDNVAVVGVQFLLDGSPLGAEDTAAPYSVTWNTSSTADGPHALTAVARDAAGNVTTSGAVNVTVRNADTTAPAVALAAPAPGATATGTTTLSATASDNVGVAGVQFLVDGTPVGAEDVSAPYSLAWDSRTVADGTHTVTARARDAAGNQTVSAARSITVANAAVDPANVGQWSPVVNWPVVAVNQVLLKDGRVLMWDGEGDGSGCIGSTSARVYDPATGLFTPVPIPYFQNHEDDIFCSAQTVLPDGRVLVVGGHDCDGPGFGIRMTNLFDPATLTWTRGPDMNFRRWYPTVTPLADGRALILGGSDMTTVDYITTPELFDPVTNTITRLDNAQLAVPSYAFVYQHTDGRVVVTGSDEAKMPTYALDVASQTWSTVDPAVLDAGSGVTYRPGEYLKAGSSYLSPPADNGGATPSRPNTYVLDMNGAAPAWQETAPMAFARTHLNLTVLPDGNVLATGGASDIGGLTSSRAVLPAEMWSPSTRTWTTLPAMATPRMYHSTALLLPDGRVLVAGGGRLGASVDYFNAEFYSPAYLFKGARPAISSSPSTLEYGSGFFVGTPDAADVASVALVRNGSVTHSDNMDQRFVPLSFQATAGGLTVQAPADARTAPPGHYMLFIVNGKGVPSVAPLVRFPAGYEDHQSPSAPSDLFAAPGAPGTAQLAWSPASDNTGVARYNGYRSTSPGFAATDAFRVGSTASTGYVDAGLASGTYYYAVRAVDAAGNVGPASGEAGVSVTADTAAPSVALTSPAPGAVVGGAVTLTAAASDDVGVAGVQFLLDGAPVGAEDTAAPYSFTWSSGTASNGSHVLTARARDAAGNTSTSAPVAVTVSNAAAAGLVAAWSFDEGAGAEAVDATGNGRNGAVSGAAWTAAGKFGNALSFDGLNDWVTVADADALDLTTGMTLEAWVNPASLSGWTTVMLKEQTGGLSYALYGSDNTGRPPAGYIRRTSDIGSAGSSALPLNTWSHLAATYDGANLRTFVNGVQVGSRSVTGAIVTSTGALRIGGNAVWGEYFKGLIDEVRVYNRALSAAEVQSDMGTRIGGTAATVTAAAVPPSATNESLATGQATSLLTSAV
jgi:hypothetical protein